MKAILALTALAVGLMAYALWITAGLRDPWLRHDWSCFYAAGSVIRQGRARQLYDSGVQLEEQAKWDGRRVPSLFLHPPFEVAVFVPFTALGQRGAHVAWGLVSFAVLGVILRTNRRSIERSGLGGRLIAVGVCLMPLLQVLADGQDGILLLGCFTLSLAMFKKDHELTAGMALGLALFRFQDVVPFLIVMVLARRWRAIAGAATVGFVYGAISVLLVGISGCKQYISMVLGTISTPGVVLTPICQMPNLRGVAAMVWGDRLPWFALVGLIVVDLALLGVTARAWRGSSLERAFGMTVCSVLLTAPHGGGDAMLVMIPCLIALESRQNAARDTQGVFGYPTLAKTEIVQGR